MTVNRICAAVLISMFFAACTPSQAEPTATPPDEGPAFYNVEGRVLLYGSAIYQGFPRRAPGVDWVSVRPGDVCHPYAPFLDVAEGMEIRVTANGSLVALGRLDQGVFGAQPDDTRIPNYAFCEFSFSIEVPTGHQFYAVDLGERSTFTYTAEEMADLRPEYFIGQ